MKCDSGRGTSVSKGAQKSLSKNKLNRPVSQLHTPLKVRNCSLEYMNRTHRKGDNILPDRYLRVGCFSIVQINRPRIIDWIFEVCFKYKLHWNTLWTCLQLLDSLIADHQYVTVFNIHLCAVVCLFISSKFNDHNPLRLKQILNSNIAKDYTRRQFLEQQSIILQKIWRSSSFIQQPNIYSFLIENHSKMSQSDSLQVLRQCALVWMNSSMVLRPNQKIMYRTLVAEVVRCVNQGIEWRDVYQIESYYLTNYGYNSIKKSYRRIQL